MLVFVFNPGIMTRLTMQSLLGFSFALCALAIPLPTKRDGASSFLGPREAPNQMLPSFGRAFSQSSTSPGDPRDSNVLYPRPAPSGVQVPLPEPGDTLAPPTSIAPLEPSTTPSIPAPANDSSFGSATNPSPGTSTTIVSDAQRNSVLASIAPTGSSVPSSQAQPSHGFRSTSSPVSPPGLQPFGPSQISSEFQAPNTTQPVVVQNVTTSFPGSTSTTPAVGSPSQSGSSPTAPAPAVAGPGNPLQLSLVNNLSSDSGNAYISALDANGRVVMITSSGSFYYLPETGSTTPQSIPADVAIPLGAPGQTTQITIPDYVEGARVWFAEGTLDFGIVSSANGPALVEPTAVRRDDGSSNTNWGFVELTWIAEYGLFANLSFVDFLGLPLAVQLLTNASGTQTVPGVPRDAVQQVCSRLQEQRSGNASDWADLCVLDANGAPIRVISPAVLQSQRPDAFSSLFREYVEQVWQRYASEPLTIDTQNSNGIVACQAVGEGLQCDGDNRGYAKPSAIDILGCNSGPFSILETDNAIHRAVVPRICAALNRGTLLLPGGNVQPALAPSDYYSSQPHNLYSALIHEVELNGRGYAFSYDDVTPSVADGVAGIVAASDPQLLTIYVGGQ